MYKIFKSSNGFTLLETLVTTLLLTIVFTAGSMLFISGQRLWSMVDGQIRLQENARQVIQKVSLELMESGRDSSDNLLVWLLQNAGPNNTDVLRFSIPLCLCGRSVMDDAMQVRTWGAPASWGGSGCTENYPLEANGKVTICKVPPGNPSNTQTIQVGPAAVKAHLATGSWIGSCTDCNPSSHNNHFVEYRMNADGQILRRVLDSNLAELSSVVLGAQVDDFQIIQQTPNQYQIQISLSTQVYPQRTIQLTRTEVVVLKNY